MTYSPKAPESAVKEIVKTFRGVSEHGAPAGWRVRFENNNDFNNVVHLINMLKGWQAEQHKDQKNVMVINAAEE